MNVRNRDAAAQLDGQTKRLRLPSEQGVVGLVVEMPGNAVAVERLAADLILAQRQAALAQRTIAVHHLALGVLVAIVEVEDLAAALQRRRVIARPGVEPGIHFGALVVLARGQALVSIERRGVAGWSRASMSMTVG